MTLTALGIIGATTGRTVIVRTRSGRDVEGPLVEVLSHLDQYHRPGWPPERLVDGLVVQVSPRLRTFVPWPSVDTLTPVPTHPAHPATS